MTAKTLSLITAIVRAAITVLGFFGFAHLVEPLELLLEQIPVVYELIMSLIGIGLLFVPYFKKAQNEVKGASIRKIYESTPMALSSDPVKGFFDFVPNKKSV